jgi:hypothetical protein
MLQLQNLLQRIYFSGGPDVVLPSIGMLIAGIILVVVGWILRVKAANLEPLGTILWIIGWIIIVVWVILLIVALCCGWYP